MKKTVPVLTGILTVFLIIGSIALTADWRTSKPSKVAKDFTVAMLDGKFNKAYKFTNAASEGVTSREFETSYSEGFSEIGYEKVLVADPAYETDEDEETAEVYLTIIKKDGRTETDSFDLVKINGQWLVDIY
ncbi:MAG: DUF4878 domain-containing protein [Lachnospiraceae bacterium]|nr:DUF4878 domain-containing protein [Lachnospiraceae bacterium]